jgi:hypothetical protein
VTVKVGREIVGLLIDVGVYVGVRRMGKDVGLVVDRADEVVDVEWELRRLCHGVAVVVCAFFDL